MEEWWEKDFDEQFVKTHKIQRCMIGNLQFFIANVLASARQEADQRVAEAVEAEREKWKQEYAEAVKLVREIKGIAKDFGVEQEKMEKSLATLSAKIK